MKRLFENPNSQLLGIGVFFLLLYIICYPTNILIFDEWKYFQQGLAYSLGDPLLQEADPLLLSIEARTPGHYPLGTPFFLATLISLLGKKAVFLQGLISLLGAFYFNIKTLKNLNMDSRFSLLLFFFFPTTLLSRTLMSDLPSLFMVSWFLYLITRTNKTKLSILGAGFIGGLSILFREPNILLILPFLIGLYSRDNLKLFISGIAGFFIAVMLRLGTSFWAFGNPFFIKDSGVSFSIQYFIENAIFYSPFLVIFVPAGLWALYKYNDMFKLEIKLSLILFLGLYFLYGYNGTHFSGVKSIILGPRFLIPTLPFFSIVLARLCETELKFIRKMLIPVSISCILGTQIVGYYYNLEQQKAFLGLENKHNKIHLIAEVNTIPKILFPSNDNFLKIYVEDSLMIEKIIKRDTFIYVETSFRDDTELANNFSSIANQRLDRLLQGYEGKETFKYTLPDNIIIRQYVFFDKDVVPSPSKLN